MTVIARCIGLTLALLSVPASGKATFSVRSDCGTRARCFQSVSAALTAANGVAADETVTILVGPGTFRDKPVVGRAKVRLIGRGSERTRIVNDAVAEHAARYDRNGWGTAGSATLTVAAADVTIKNMTIENDFDYLTNDALAGGDPKKISNSQAVAVTLDFASDRVLFDRVALLGYQDTLFTRGRRAVVRRSLVAGNVDFIFGNGTLLIEHSEVRTRRRGAAVPVGDFASFVTAPSTPLSQPMGIVVYRSRLTREAGVANASVALGRPWHPTTTFVDGRYADPNAVGQALFIDCWMDAHIHPDGWTSMAGTARDGTKTAIFRAEDARFAEVASRGPGAASRRVKIDWTAVPSIAAIKRR